MAYQIKALDIPSGVSIDIEKDSLNYLMATGQLVNSLYYDNIVHTVKWCYCGKEYHLTDIKYDNVVVANDHSGFCGYDKACNDVDFYNAVGELVFSYHFGDEAEFPLSLGNTMILYIFRTQGEAWWIYRGKLRRIAVENVAEKVEIGFHSCRYIKVMSRLRDIVYDAEGAPVFVQERYPTGLTIGTTDISINKEVDTYLLERYGLIAVCEYDEELFYTAISLYEPNGVLYAEIPLPENTSAFHSIKLLEHTDIPVVACYEELPDITRYFNNGIADSVKPNMPIKLRWYELLPNDDGILAMYRSGSLYQGFRDIDTITLEDRHINWR